VRSISRGAIAAVACSALVGVARADEPREGFGHRAKSVFSVENVFGYGDVHIKGGEDTTSSAAHGLLAPWTLRVGYSGIGESGLSGTGLVGFSHYNPTPGSAINLVDVGGRIGYAGALKPAFGYWLRTGPKVVLAQSKDDSAYAFSWALDALLVVLPGPHVGMLFGFTYEVPVYGRSEDADFNFTYVGLTAGVLADF
jgi:hypothetical protein